MACHRQLLIAIAILAVFGQARVARGQEQLQARFLREASERWKEYLRLAQELQGTVSFTVMDRATKEPLNRSDQEFKQSGQSAVLVYQNHGTKKKNGVAYGSNPNYGFRLERRDPDAAWLIAMVDEASEHDRSNTVQDLLDRK